MIPKIDNESTEGRLHLRDLFGFLWDFRERRINRRSFWYGYLLSLVVSEIADAGQVDVGAGCVLDGDGTQSWMEALAGRMSPKSSGEARAEGINRMLEALQSAPDFRKTKLRAGINDTWKTCLEGQLKILSKAPKEPWVTILIDEPERHLDVGKRLHLWTQYIPHIAKHAQVFVATHCPLALSLLNEGLWIESEPGEAQKTLDVYRKALR